MPLLVLVIVLSVVIWIAIVLTVVMRSLIMLSVVKLNVFICIKSEFVKYIAQIIFPLDYGNLNKDAAMARWS
jgi:hypothetical protein